MREIRVAVVDDHELFRDGLRSVLEREVGAVVVSETGDARSALQRFEQGLECDLILIDIALSGSDGLGLVRELRRRGYQQPALLLTMHVDLDMIVEGIRAGARGYVFKSQSPSQLRQAIGDAFAGRIYLPPTIDAARVEELIRAANKGGEGSALAVLSPREREVFELLIRGCSNAAVGAELAISAKTVETHRAHIFAKLGVHSIIGLVRVAARHNLLVPLGPL
jgi:DNA-binding NarL/FixJ family response regulator